jgi:hypothetical protein
MGSVYVTLVHNCVASIHVPAHQWGSVYVTLVHTYMFNCTASTHVPVHHTASIPVRHRTAVHLYLLALESVRSLYVSSLSNYNLMSTGLITCEALAIQQHECDVISALAEFMVDV